MYRVNFGKFVIISFDDELRITEREDSLGTGMCNLRSLPLNTFLCQIGPSLSNIVIYHQNYHDITSFTNLTTFILYKILKVCIKSVMSQIMKWHNKDPGSKNLSPPKSCPQKYITSSITWSHKDSKIYKISSFKTVILI